jgi:hypothetical protein
VACFRWQFSGDAQRIGRSDVWTALCCDGGFSQCGPWDAGVFSKKVMSIAVAYICVVQVHKEACKGGWQEALSDNALEQAESAASADGNTSVHTPPRCARTGGCLLQRHTLAQRVEQVDVYCNGKHATSLLRAQKWHSE